MTKELIKAFIITEDNEIVQVPEPAEDAKGFCRYATDEEIRVFLSGNRKGQMSIKQKAEKIIEALANKEENVIMPSEIAAVARIFAEAQTEEEKQDIYFMACLKMDNEALRCRINEDWAGYDKARDMLSGFNTAMEVLRRAAAE